MSKYIIKNCPAFVLMRTATSGTYFNMCGDAKGHIKCADCTDCVLKQIVELYKEQTQFCKDCSTLTCEDCSFSTNGFAEEVIELLDIQEIE